MDYYQLSYSFLWLYFCCPSLLSWPYCYSMSMCWLYFYFTYRFPVNPSVSWISLILSIFAQGGLLFLISKCCCFFLLFVFHNPKCIISVCLFLVYILHELLFLVVSLIQVYLSFFPFLSCTLFHQHLNNLKVQISMNACLSISFPFCMDLREKLKLSFFFWNQEYLNLNYC